jgi:hypothetical protein
VSALPALLIAVAAPAATLAAQERGPMERLEELGRAIRGREAWQATYHQEYIAAGMSAGEEVAGTVWISWPDRAHFRAGDPLVRMMGMDGHRVRLVDLEAETCDDHRLDDDEWSRIPLAAVLDPRQAVDRFAILAHGADGLALVPREPGGVARVEVELGPGRLPIEVVVVDPQGATNRLRFTAWRAAVAPAGGAWLPEAPAGFECTVDQDRSVADAD